MFGPTDDQVASFEPRYDADGTVWRQAKAHGALTAKTPYRLTFDQYGPVTEAFSSSTTYYRVIVPDETIASDAIFWGQTGGYRTSMVTPSLNVHSNDGYGMDGAAIADLGAYAEQGNAFAIAQHDAGAAVTSQAVMLLDREILEVA